LINGIESFIVYNCTTILLSIPFYQSRGVELGKVLANKVRSSLKEARTNGVEVTGYNPSTTALLKKYLSK
jgi:hypothetical protein